MVQVLLLSTLLLAVSVKRATLEEDLASMPFFVIIYGDITPNMCGSALITLRWVLGPWYCLKEVHYNAKHVWARVGDPHQRKEVTIQAVPLSPLGAARAESNFKRGSTCAPIKMEPPENFVYRFLPRLFFYYYWLTKEELQAKTKHIKLNSNLLFPDITGKSCKLKSDELINETVKYTGNCERSIYYGGLLIYDFNWGDDRRFLAGFFREAPCTATNCFAKMSFYKKMVNYYIEDVEKKEKAEKRSLMMAKGTKKANKVGSAKPTVEALLVTAMLIWAWV